MRRLHDNLHRLSERTGLALAPFAQQADADRSILFCTGRPPRGSAVWKIARADAATTNISPEAADAQIIVVFN